MKRSLILIGATSLVLLASPALGQGRGHGGGHDASAAHESMGSAMSDRSTLDRRSSTTDTLRGPDSTGQPGVECGDEGALNRPGNAASAPGSAFNEEGRAGEVYAGEQPQNSRNTASVSQYDTACAHQPR